MSDAVQAIGVEEVASRAHRILDEIERAVIGKRDALELALSALLADGHVLIEDYPGLAKTLIARSFAAVTATRFTRIQFTPDLMPSDVTGASIFNQRDGGLRVPARARVHEPSAGRRDQPGPAEDAGGAARGDAGATGDDRGAHAPARAPLPRDRDPEPDRVRGHLSAARGAARPLPAANAGRLPVRRGRMADPGAARRAERRRGRAETVVDGEELLAMQHAIEQVHVSESVGRYIVDLVAATRGVRASRSGPARAGRSR